MVTACAIVVAARIHFLPVSGRAGGLAVIEWRRSIGGMEPGSVGVNWGQVVGELCGGALVVAAEYGFWLWREREKERRKERPPQEEKILRPAGYFALCKLDELSDKAVLALIEGLGAGALFGAVAGSLWSVAAGLALGRFRLTELVKAPRSDVFLAAALLALVALLFTVHGLERFWRITKELRDWRFGMRGEQAVAEKLMSGELAAAGYTVFHDVPAERGGKKFNLDHVVVGPGGVFVLETKARARRRAKWDQKEDVVKYDGSRILFPWCWDDEAVRQVRSNVGWLRGLLADYGGNDLAFWPVVVVPGWRLDTGGNYEVKVMNADFLVDKYILTLARPYPEEQLRGVRKRLDEACRTLEF